MRVTMSHVMTKRIGVNENLEDFVRALTGAAFAHFDNKPTIIVEFNDTKLVYEPGTITLSYILSILQDAVTKEDIWIYISYPDSLECFHLVKELPFEK